MRSEYLQVFRCTIACRRYGSCSNFAVRLGSFRSIYRIEPVVCSSDEISSPHRIRSAAMSVYISAFLIAFSPSQLNHDSTRVNPSASITMPLTSPARPIPPFVQAPANSDCPSPHRPALTQAIDNSKSSRFPPSVRLPPSSKLDFMLGLLNFFLPHTSCLTPSHTESKVASTPVNRI